jgi:tRNA-splicing ligase RtcB
VSEPRYVTIETPGGVPVKAWVRGVEIADNAKQQLQNVARLPFVHRWVAAMPDVHLGYGATVGSVIPTHKAIVPAAVGVDIGCGMMASRTSLVAADLPENLRGIRTAIEKAVPHGRSHHGGRRDQGSWGEPPKRVRKAWRALEPGHREIVAKHPHIERGRTLPHLGTLGTGNHFIEVCLDQDDRVWFVLHSGSRGVGNLIGRYFMERAKKDMGKVLGTLPDRDLAYFTEGTEHFDDYVHAVAWAQDFARRNRLLMMEAVVEAVSRAKGVPRFDAHVEAVNCHHNYVEKEHHFGADVYVTRKGAVRAGRGEMGIIPGSMGARSYIVRGLGNAESFESCSHGAGRTMSRNEAKRRISLDQHLEAVAHVECRRDAGVIDETPAAYKDIDAVMEAQRDLVEIVHTLRQVVCVKG